MLPGQSRQQMLYTSPPHHSSNPSLSAGVTLQGAGPSKIPVKALHTQKPIFTQMGHRDSLGGGKQQPVMTEGQEQMRGQHQHHQSTGFLNSRVMHTQIQPQSYKLEMRSPSIDNNSTNKENMQLQQRYGYQQSSQPGSAAGKNSGTERTSHHQAPGSPKGSQHKGSALYAWQQQQQQQSAVSEAVKIEVSEQMESFRRQLVEGYESLMKDFLSQNQQTADDLRIMKENIEQHENVLRDVGDNLQQLQTRVQQSASQVSAGSDTGDDQSGLKNKITDKIRESYGQKIKQIEQGQNELREVLENVRGELFEEIQSQMERVAESVREKSTEEDAKLYDYVRDLRTAWDERMTMIVQTMTAKMDSFERQLNEMRTSENIKDVQTQMYAEMDACVNECEKQLMQVKMALDGKLDRSELEEVIEGYRAAKASESVVRQAAEVQALRVQIAEQSAKAQKYEKEFESRLQSFESFMQNTVSEMEARFKERQAVADGEKNLALRIQGLEQKLNEGRRDITQLTQDLERFDSRFNDVKRESDERLQRVIADLQREERDVSVAQRESNNRQQEYGARMTTLEKQLAQLVAKMRDFEDGLERDVSDFTQTKLVREAVIPSATQQQGSGGKGARPAQQSQKASLGSEDLDNCPPDVLSHKLETYLKKYENFSNNVSSYLQQKQTGAQNTPSPFQKQQQPSAKQGTQSGQKEVYNHPQIGAVNIQEISSPQRGLTAQNITNSPCVSLYNASAGGTNANSAGRGTGAIQHVRQSSLDQVQKHLRMSAEEAMSGASVKSSTEEQVFREQQKLSSITEREGEDDEVIYQLDERGYLLDENGNMILDDEGRPIQLTQEHIEYLRGANMLEDDQK